MKVITFVAILVILVMGALCGPSFGQQPRVFNWLPANDETVRLDPAFYHTGHTFHPGPEGGKNHVDIRTERPVTIFMTPAADWNAALQHPETIPNLPQSCLAEHVVNTTYICDMPPTQMTLVIRDERYNPESAVFAGLGAVLEPLNPNDKTERAISAGISGITAVIAAQRSETRRFKDPNDVHIQYYRWDCVENCIQPEFQWTRQVKEKYELTGFVKVYGGFAPDHDGEQVSIKIKSPVPMVVAILPSRVADQLHAQPDALETALQKNACQQRGVQSLEFQCTFNQGDGPQSLVVAPEAGMSVPHHKKAEIEMQAVRCVANCGLLQSQQ